MTIRRHPGKDDDFLEEELGEKTEAQKLAEELGIIEDEAAPKPPRKPLAERTGYRVGAVLLFAATLIFIITRFIGGGDTAPANDLAQTPPASTLVRLDSWGVAALGELEGPYYYSETVTPRVIELADSRLQSFRVELLGLRNRPYEEPPPPPSEITPEKEEALRRERVRQEELYEALRAFKVAAMDALCEDRQIWLVRMNDADPPQVYAFLPVDRNILEPGETPKGPAHLLNALALRRGKAHMEFEGQVHPFYDMMRAALLAAYLEGERAAQSNGLDSGNLWTRFDTYFPSERFEDELEALRGRI